MEKIIEIWKKIMKVHFFGYKLMSTFIFQYNHNYVTDYLEKGKSVSSTLYIETLKKLRRRDVCRVRVSTETILLQNDNTWPPAEQQAPLSKNWSCRSFNTPTYSPDLAPCDFYFFTDLTRNLKSTPFTSNEEVKESVKSWTKERQLEKMLVTVWRN